MVKDSRVGVVDSEWIILKMHNHHKCQNEGYLACCEGHIPINSAVLTLFLICYILLFGPFSFTYLEADLQKQNLNKPLFSWPMSVLSLSFYCLCFQTLSPTLLKFQILPLPPALQQLTCLLTFSTFSDDSDETNVLPLSFPTLLIPVFPDLSVWPILSDTWTSDFPACPSSDLFACLPDLLDLCLFDVHLKKKKQIKLKFVLQCFCVMLLGSSLPLVQWC